MIWGSSSGRPRDSFSGFRSKLDRSSVFPRLDDEMDDVVLVQPVQHVRGNQKALGAIVLSVEWGHRPFLKEVFI
ncbi:MAG: hypothetical protein ACYCTV_00435 [Leptospirales bacterium]